jgi:hypothetical protein
MALVLARDAMRVARLAQWGFLPLAVARLSLVARSCSWLLMVSPSCPWLLAAARCLSQACTDQATNRPAGRARRPYLAPRGAVMRLVVISCARLVNMLCQGLFARGSTFIHAPRGKKTGSGTSSR